MKSNKILNLKPLCDVVYSNKYGVYMVVYRGVALWSTVYPTLDDCEIYLDECDGEYTIFGTTPVYFDPSTYDYSTYGTWYSEEEAMEWIHNPVPLY